MRNVCKKTHLHLHLHLHHILLLRRLIPKPNQIPKLIIDAVVRRVVEGGLEPHHGVELRVEGHGVIGWLGDGEVVNDILHLVHIILLTHPFYCLLLPGFIYFLKIGVLCTEN